MAQTLSYAYKEGMVVVVLTQQEADALVIELARANGVKRSAAAKRAEGKIKSATDGERRRKDFRL